MNRKTIEPKHHPLRPDRPSTNSRSEQQQTSMDVTNQQAIVGMGSLEAVLRSWKSADSIGSRTTEEKMEDELFDKIEDLLCDFMRDPDQHHFHCRALQWSTPGDPSRVLNAAIVITPPIQKS